MVGSYTNLGVGRDFICVLFYFQPVEHKCGSITSTFYLEAKLIPISITYFCEQIFFRT